MGIDRTTAQGMSLVFSALQKPGEIMSVIDNMKASDNVGAFLDMASIAVGSK